MLIYLFKMVSFHSFFLNVYQRLPATQAVPSIASARSRHSDPPIPPCRAGSLRCESAWQWPRTKFSHGQKEKGSYIALHCIT